MLLVHTFFPTSHGLKHDAACQGCHKVWASTVEARWRTQVTSADCTSGYAEVHVSAAGLSWWTCVACVMPVAEVDTRGGSIRVNGARACWSPVQTAMTGHIALEFLLRCAHVLLDSPF